MREQRLFSMYVPRLLLLAAALMFTAIAHYRVEAQSVSLPSPISNLTTSGAFVTYDGFRFDSFQIQAGQNVWNSATVYQDAYHVRRGLNFKFGDGGVAATFGSPAITGKLSFSVTPPTNLSLIHMYISVTTDVGMAGYVIAGSTVSDVTDPIGHQEPISVGITSSGVLPNLLTDAESFAPGVRRASLVTDLNIENFTAASTARLKEVTIEFSTDPASIQPGDYDFDDDVDGADYMAWRKSFGSPVILQADGNRNGIVDAGDYIVWRKKYQPQIGPPGDFDGDGDVDPADYQAWRQAFGSNSSAPDGNKNGVVDAADYVIWRKAQGVAGNGSTSAMPVPEPACIAILLCGIAAAFLIYRSRR